MTPEPVWISKALALAIHGRLAAEHGGLATLRDEGALDSALASPRNHFLHGEIDLFVLATVHARALTRNHPFHDGNKRLSLTLAGVFLELNGYRLDAPEQEAALITIALAARDVDQAGYAEWLRASCSKLRRRKRR